jgi:hypothetical protein
MKYIKKFNESLNPSYNNEDIEEIFLDLIDNGAKLTITDSYLTDKNEVIKVTPYIKNPSNVRHCKTVHLNLKEDPNGMYLRIAGMGTKTMTSIELLEDITSRIKRFYSVLQEKDENFLITSDYTGVNIYFVLKGDYLTDDLNKSELVDQYLSKLKDILKLKYNYRNISIRGNWLDMKGKDAEAKRYKLHKVIDGTYNEENPIYIQSKEIKEMIDWYNEIRNNNLNVYVSGGDKQMVVQIKF